GRFLRAEVALQGIAVRLSKVVDDEGRVGDGASLILDPGDLSLWPLAGIRDANDFEGQAGHAQPGLELHAKRARVGEPEHRWILVQANHGHPTSVTAIRAVTFEPSSEKALTPWRRK